MASGSNVDLVLAASSLSSSLAMYSCGAATVHVALVLLLECFVLRPLLIASAELIAGGVAVLCVLLLTIVGLLFCFIVDQSEKLLYWFLFRFYASNFIFCQVEHPGYFCVGRILQMLHDTSCN